MTRDHTETVEQEKPREILTFPPLASPSETRAQVIAALKDRLDAALEQLRGRPIRRMEFKAIVMGVVMDFLEEVR